MHGRPRKPLKQEDAAALSAKAEKLRSLQSQFLTNHHNRMLVTPLSHHTLISTLYLFYLFLLQFDFFKIHLQIHEGSARCERQISGEQSRMAHCLELQKARR